MLSEEDERHLCELDWETGAVLLPPVCYLNYTCDLSAMRKGINVYAWRDIHPHLLPMSAIIVVVRPQCRELWYHYGVFRQLPFFSSQTLARHAGIVFPKAPGL